MKFIYALALSAAALATAQAPPAAALPECAKECFGKGLAESGCKADDIKCTCTSKKMGEVIGPCVQSGCTEQKDQIAVMRFSIASCASAGIKIAVPGADGAAPAPTRSEGEAPAAPAGDAAPAPSRAEGDAAAPPAGDAPAPSRAGGDAPAPSDAGAAGAGAGGAMPMPSGGATGAMAPPAGAPGAPAGEAAPSGAAPSGTESAPAVQTANTAAFVKGSSVLGFLSALTVLLAF